MASPPESYDYLYKVVVCGESLVGKSSIIQRFANGQFSTETKKTIGVEFATSTVTKNGRKIKLQVWDLGGDPKIQHRNLVSGFFRGAMGIILVFDITDRTSFEKIREWVSEIHDRLQEHDSNVPKILVGNKADLDNLNLRDVSYEEASNYAAEIEATYLECSAATGDGISTIFENMASEIYEQTSSKAYSAPAASSRPASFMMPAESARHRRGLALPSIDNVFGDLENMFNGLGNLVYECTCYPHLETTPKMKAVLFVPRLIIQLFMYILFFTLLVLVLLPSFFWLLLLRTRTVEIESKDFGIRQDVLSQESTARKSFRVISVMFRSVPMTFLLGCWPIIIILSIIPNFAAGSHPSQTSSVVLWAIGTHLVLILSLQLMGTIRNGKSLDMKEQAKIVQFQDKPFRWKNLGNWIAMATLTVDFVQMAMYPLQRLQPDTGGSSHKMMVLKDGDDSSSGSSPFIDFLVQDLIPALFLRLSAHLYEITFFISFGCVALLMLIFTYQFMQDLLVFTDLKKNGKSDDANTAFFHSFVGAMVYGHGMLKNISSKVTGIVSFLSDAMFMTICSQLLSMLSCSYSSDFTSFKTGALLSNPDVQCWEGAHRYKAIVALVSFSYYVPLCVMVAPMFMSCDPEKKDVRFVETYMMTLTLTKCALLVFSTFFSQSNLLMVIATMLISLALLISTFFWSLSKPRLLKPCTQPFANILKCTTYSTAIWTSVVALTFYAAGNKGYMNQQAQWIAIGIGILLNVIAGVTWFLIYWLPTRHHAKFQPLPEEEVELTNTLHS